MATAAIGGFVLAGCGSPDSEQNETTGEPQSGGTLIYASGDAEPDCLDPHYGGNYPQGLIATQYLETLFTKNADGDIVPWLAETSEVSEDGLTHTISVTDGITFHDGTPLTSEAIKANVEHLQDPDGFHRFLAVEKSKKSKMSMT